jgi:hypothetical protein
MKYLSIRNFVKDVIASIERDDPDFTLLDITDPANETRLESLDGRFHHSVSESFDDDTVVMLLEKAKNSSYINEVFLGYVDLGHSVSMALLDLFQDGRTWKRLTIQGCPDQVAEISVALLVSRGNVESLCLYQNDLEYSGFSSLGLILASNPEIFSTLDVEDLFCVDSAKALSAGLKRNTNLKALDLHECRFESGAMDELVLGIRQNNSLCHLDLSSCVLLDDEVACLLRALPEHHPLRELNLDSNFCGSEACDALASLIQSDRAPSLSSISLENQNTYSRRLDVCLGIGVLGGVLATNTSLKTLKLSYNRIDDMEFAFFMLGVHESCLENLDLGQCGITDTMATTILSNLPQTLKTLDMSQNDFGNDTTRAVLLETAKAHDRLEVLELDKGVDGWSEIDYLIRLNAAGRRICSSQKMVPCALWTLILRRIIKKDWKYYDEFGEGFCEDALFYILNTAMVSRN